MEKKNEQLWVDIIELIQNRLPIEFGSMNTLRVKGGCHLQKVLSSKLGVLFTILIKSWLSHPSIINCLSYVNVFIGIYDTVVGKFRKQP